MSLPDCPKCWETPCTCGYEYESRSTEWLIEMREVFDNILNKRRLSKTSTNALPANIVSPKPCPFCGEKPMIGPKRPEIDGGGWGQVICINPKCAAQPDVQNRETDSLDPCSEDFKRGAIELWNTRRG